MKVVKASNGKTQIILSKKEWKEIGRTAGWFKVAYQVETIKRQMEEDYSSAQDFIDWYYNGKKPSSLFYRDEYGDLELIEGNYRRGLDELEVYVWSKNFDDFIVKWYEGGCENCDQRDKERLEPLRSKYDEIRSMATRILEFDPS
jgi:hypothetical protein